jgi:hypothetical protein
MKMRYFGIAALMSAALLSTSLANANMYSFDFLADNNTYDVSGQFTTANALNTVGGYDILAITGTVTGSGGGSIASLVNNPNQPNPVVNFGFIYDNVAFPTAVPHLNTNGVLFTTTAGDVWNLWGNTPTQYQLYSYTANGGVNVFGTMSLAAVPEPETYAMMMAGLAMMGFIARRRKNGA